MMTDAELGRAIREAYGMQPKNVLPVCVVHALAGRARAAQDELARAEPDMDRTRALIDKLVDFLSLSEEKSYK